MFATSDIGILSQTSKFLLFREICLVLFLHSPHVFALMSIIYVLFPPFHNSVMLGDSSVASSKFFDFGLAVEKATGTLRAGTFCGTDRYISPELERGEEKDLQYQAPFADVHSTAMTVIAYIIGIEKFDNLPGECAEVYEQLLAHLACVVHAAEELKNLENSTEKKS